MKAALTLLASALMACAAPSAEQLSLNRTNLLQFTAGGKVVPVRTVRDWQQRRTAILEAMQKVMGPFPGEAKRCPLEVRYHDETDCGDYVRHSISYLSEPGGRVPAYLLVPKKTPGGPAKFPALLGLHQTHPLGQKVAVGLGQSTNDEYGVRLVKRGFVVLAPPYPLLADYHPDLKALGYVSGTMKAIWDNVRGLDLLVSLPYVRTNNGFGTIGHSLGGHNGIYTAAFDDRIRVIVSSCGFDAFRDYKDGSIRGWTSKHYMPRLLDYSADTRPFDFQEVIGCLAPRWFFVNAPVGDSNFKWRSVDDVCASARSVFDLYGVTNRLQVHHPDCSHLFPPEMQNRAFEFLESVLKE